VEQHKTKLDKLKEAGLIGSLNDSGITSQSYKMQWIRVEHQLPGGFEKVLVTDGKNVTVALFESGFIYLILPYIEIVTHWMSLPIPPKEEPIYEPLHPDEAWCYPWEN